MARPQATFLKGPVLAPEVGGPCLWGSFVDPGQRHTGSALGLRDAQVCVEQTWGPQNPFPDLAQSTERSWDQVVVHGPGKMWLQWPLSSPSEDRGVGGAGLLGLLWLSHLCSGRD